MSGPDRFPGGLGALGIHEGLVTNYGGGGGLQNGRGGTSQVLPLQKGGRAQTFTLS